MAVGYTNLWSDGHANEFGKYILCVTFYATLYKKDPAGAGITGFTGLDQAFATKVQQVAWSVVKSYPMSGVGTVDVAKPAGVTQRNVVQSSRVDARSVNLAGRVVRQTGAKGTVPAVSIGATRATVVAR
jgi:hypothetical protein